MGFACAHCIRLILVDTLFGHHAIDFSHCQEIPRRRAHFLFKKKNLLTFLSPPPASPVTAMHR